MGPGKLEPYPQRWWPLAGGALLTWFFWGSVFFVNVPVVAAGLIAIWLLVPGSKSAEVRPIDFRGAALSFPGLLALFFGLIRGPDKGWTDPAVLIGFALAALLLFAFAWLELLTTYPLLDVRFFKIPAFTSGVISIAIGFFALFGLLYVLTIYLQSVLSYSPMEAGLALVPFAIVLLVGSPLVPRLVTRAGQRAVVSVGLLVTGSGMVVFGLVTTSTGYPLILAGLLLVSAGLIMAQVPSSDAIMGSIPRDRAGEGSATNAAIRQIGSSLGIAVIGGISQLGYSNAIAGSQAFQALPGTAAVQAEAGLSGALAVSESMGASGDALAAAARSAFVSGLDLSMIITAVVAFAGAIIAFRYIPGRKQPSPAKGGSVGAPAGGTRGE